MSFAVLLTLFALMTLSNEIFDLPHYLLGDEPTSFAQRKGEVLFELLEYSTVIALSLLYFRRKLQKDIQDPRRLHPDLRQLQKDQTRHRLEDAGTIHQRAFSRDLQPRHLSRLHQDALSRICRPNTQEAGGQAILAGTSRPRAFFATSCSAAWPAGCARSDTMRRTIARPTTTRCGGAPCASDAFSSPRDTRLAGTNRGPRAVLLHVNDTPGQLRELHDALGIARQAGLLTRCRSSATPDCAERRTADQGRRSAFPNTSDGRSGSSGPVPAAVVSTGTGLTGKVSLRRWSLRSPASRPRVLRRLAEEGCAMNVTIEYCAV